MESIHHKVQHGYYLGEEYFHPVQKIEPAYSKDNYILTTYYKGYSYSIIGNKEYIKENKCVVIKSMNTYIKSIEDEENKRKNYENQIKNEINEISSYKCN